MCMGTPMQVIKSGWFSAHCQDRDGSVIEVDTRLVGEVAGGQWLLVFTGAAREIMDENRAADILAAICALEAALAGDYQAENHFADLLSREPSLPPHLQAQLKKTH